MQNPSFVATMNPNIVHRPEDFGGVLFDLETKDFFPVNDLGYKIVTLLDAGTPLPRITQEIADHYAATLRQRFPLGYVEGIRDRFLTQLHHIGALREFDPPPSNRTIAGEQVEHQPAAKSDVPLPPIRLRAPLVVSLAALFQCNLSCGHCYVSSTNEKKPDNLTQEEVLAIIFRMSELGVFDIVVTGGEALMFRGIYEVVRYAKELGLYVCLNTNGTLVTSRVAGTLHATGVDVVKISVDSATPSIHDAFRGQQRAFERSMNGIRYLRRQGIRVDIHSVISAESTRSEQDIDAIVELARELGVTRVHFGRVFSTGRATDELKLANERVLRLSDYVAELKAHGEAMIGRIPTKAMPVVPSIPTYDGCGGCARGVYAYISYNGGIYPCTNLYKKEWFLGSLREQDLGKILECSPVLADLRCKLADAEKTLATSGAAVHE